MIRWASHKSLRADGLPATLMILNPAQTLAVSVPSWVGADFATPKSKNVLCTSNADAITGSQRQSAPPFQEAAARQSLNQSRQSRYVLYSEVAAVDDPSSELDAAKSQGLEFNPFRQRGSGFNADLFQKQTEELKQEILSGDFELKPTPYTPTDGIEAVQFYAICALLFVAFWVGNYLAPDLIFKDTVFRKDGGEDDHLKQDFAKDREQGVESEQRQGRDPAQSVDSVAGSMKSEDGQKGKLGVGFGKASEQTRKKPRRSIEVYMQDFHRLIHLCLK